MGTKLATGRLAPLERAGWEELCRAVMPFDGRALAAGLLAECDAAASDARASIRLHEAVGWDKDMLPWVTLHRLQQVIAPEVLVHAAVTSMAASSPEAAAVWAWLDPTGPVLPGVPVDPDRVVAFLAGGAPPAGAVTVVRAAVGLDLPGWLITVLAPVLAGRALELTSEVLAVICGLGRPAGEVAVQLIADGLDVGEALTAARLLV
jgi:hypothetical protein